MAGKVSKSYLTLALAIVSKKPMSRAKVGNRLEMYRTKQGG